MTPKYSIVCAAYNVEQFIDETIASVLAQTEPDWELIVVDDGSTDRTVERIRRYEDSRIRLIQQSNQGPSAARNAGIAAFRGARLMILDSDDVLHPTALARLGAALGSDGAIATYGQCDIISEEGQFIGKLYRQRNGYPPSGEILAFVISRNLFVNGGHVCIDGTVARSVGMFREDLPVGEDHEYWCRLAMHGRIAYVGDSPPVLYYRRRRGSWYKLKSREPAYHQRFVKAVFENPELMARFSRGEQRRLRKAAEARGYWIVAREHIRHGDWRTARLFLARSLLKKLDYKRAAVLVLTLFGGVPEFVQRRFVDLKKYEFLR